VSKEFYRKICGQGRKVDINLSETKTGSQRLQSNTRLIDETLTSKSQDSRVLLEEIS
jgi:hypothetical protein